MLAQQEINMSKIRFMGYWGDEQMWREETAEDRLLDMLHEETKRVVEDDKEEEDYSGATEQNR